MDILTKKYKFNDQIRNILNNIHIGPKRIEIKGSSSLYYQKYFSDYDLYQEVEIKGLFDKLYSVLEYINRNPFTFFIEMKFQNKDQKFRFYRGDKFNENEFKKAFDKNKTEFIKIDFVIYADYRLVECSIIYSLNRSHPEDYIIDLKNDIVDLKADGNYYKILKRIFSLNAPDTLSGDLIKADEKLLKMLTKFFNSDIGADYQKISELRAIELLQEHYKDDNLINKMIETVLKNIRISKKNIKQTIKSLSERINEEALKFINDNKIKI